MSELLPCPFCGGEPAINTGEVEDEGYCWAYITCPLCGILFERSGETEDEAKETAANTWNTRHERTCQLENLDGPLPEEVMEMLEVWLCSECGSPIYNDMTPTYCPYCGAKVVDE